MVESIRNFYTQMMDFLELEEIKDFPNEAQEIDNIFEELRQLHEIKILIDKALLEENNCISLIDIKKALKV
jgi:hypothetical protein